MDKNSICIAAYSKSEDRLKSSSGGVFAELSKKVLEKNGVVFGAAIDSDGKVFHKYVTKKEDLNQLLGSKYVQSNINTAYKDVRKFLKEDRIVLFCGTPCQNEGLLKFLKSRPENLILVDFICHGVPSHKVFSSYLKEISNGKEIDNISFRNKENGWLDYSFKVSYKDGTCFSENFKKNAYMRGFVFDFFLRPSCYKCTFKGVDRNTDITMGDFWGIQEEEPEFYEKDGVSVLIIHSEKGQKLFSEIEQVVVSKKISADEIVRHNQSLVKASNESEMRTLFFYEMKKGVKKAVDGIINPNKVQKLRNKIYRVGRKIIRKCLKKKMNTLSSNTGSKKVPVLFEQKENCCGCYSCSNACPVSAITMHEDKEGFFYPIIQKDLCVGCNSCKNACPINKK